MSPFQTIGLVLLFAWLALVGGFFRRSRPVLLGGLIIIGGYAIAAMALGRIDPAALGLASAAPLLLTGLSALAGLAVLLVYSPLADWIATRLVAEPPTLGAFKAIKGDLAMLVLGIAVVWILGGFLEELIFRGLMLQAIESLIGGRLPVWVSAAIAIGLAALGAGVIHLYQGLRAAIIITQLSVLFGLTFVLSGHNLWAVILAHGAYDTIAFIRFSTGASNYSRFADEA
jgi:membrane protease YdiL (CAAX protease family)